MPFKTDRQHDEKTNQQAVDSQLDQEIQAFVQALELDEQHAPSQEVDSAKDQLQQEIEVFQQALELDEKAPSRQEPKKDDKLQAEIDDFVVNIQQELQYDKLDAVQTEARTEIQDQQLLGFAQLSEQQIRGNIIFQNEQELKKILDQFGSTPEDIEYHAKVHTASQKEFDAIKLKINEFNKAHNKAALHGLKINRKTPLTYTDKDGIKQTLTLNFSYIIAHDKKNDQLVPLRLLAGKSRAISTPSSMVTLRPSFIGKGAFGAVKLFQRENGDSDVVKVQRPGSLQEYQETEKEAKILAQLDINTGVSLAVKKSSPLDRPQFYHKNYTLMQKAPGARLGQIILTKLSKPLPSSCHSLKSWQQDSLSRAVETPLSKEDDMTKLQVAKNLIAAVNEIHSKKIAHNDLKGENIHYDPKTKKVTLVDFGLAKAIPSELEPRGTPLYMAPEIYAKATLERIPKGYTNNSGAQDIYALAHILMYNCDLSTLYTENGEFKQLIDSMLSNSNRPTATKALSVLDSVLATESKKIATVRPTK